MERLNYHNGEVRFSHEDNTWQYRRRRSYIWVPCVWWIARSLVTIRFYDIVFPDWYTRTLPTI